MVGKKNKVDAVVKEDIYFTVPKRKKSIIKVIIEYQGPLKAPIKKDDKIGILKVYSNNDVEKEYDVFSNEDIKKANIFLRLLKSLNFLVWGDA